MTYHLKCLRCPKSRGIPKRFWKDWSQFLDARSIGSVLFSERFEVQARILGFGPEILGAVRGLGLRAQVGQRAQAFRG